MPAIEEPALPVDATTMVSMPFFFRECGDQYGGPVLERTGGIGAVVLDIEGIEAEFFPQASRFPQERIPHRNRRKEPRRHRQHFCDIDLLSRGRSLQFDLQNAG
jgi:hypothetical protein